MPCSKSDGTVRFKAMICTLLSVMALDVLSVLLELPRHDPTIQIEDWVFATKKRTPDFLRLFRRSPRTYVSGSMPAPEAGTQIVMGHGGLA